MTNLTEMDKRADVLPTKICLRQRGERKLAALLLFVASGLGILNALISPIIIGKHTPLFSTDLIAYVVLAGAAWLIYKSVPLARLIYTVLAVTWYISLIGFLPEHLGQMVDLYIIFMQLVLTVIALVVLMAPRHS